ncbi:MAG: hypothetical protein JNL57_11435 [Bacteroidetes bacterium]|nr:hypothetical protein [Bacteroidota bacterium]
MKATKQTPLQGAIGELLNNIPDGFTDASRGELQSLFNHIMTGTQTASRELMVQLLANAVSKRFNPASEEQHIYLKNDEVPQIQLFNILIEKFPFVKYSQIITNKAITETIGDSKEAAIIDIGIGQGVQMLHVIELAKKLPKLKKLNIIGIEPFSDALIQAEKNIMAQAKNVHFTIEFTGVNNFAENVDFSPFINISDTLIINASLALHHIQTEEKRSQIISKFKQLNPAAFLLIEPNVNHYETNFCNRFINCFNHYYNLFLVIDRLDIDEKDKNALKLFFGREISDVIGKEEKDRFEKHEKATKWIERMQNAGFSLNTSMLKSPVESESGVDIRIHNEGFMGFTHQIETILAVMYAN